ncbi:hypothetical protein ABKN59_006966 [Abortiporus biennis]
MSVRSSAASHVSRRDNQSVYSTHSSTRSESSRTERGSSKHGAPAVESAVTRLLVAIKQLLECLTQWSTQQASEAQVSDVYVRLGNDFNAAAAAFATFGIDMSELLMVPDDLRQVLEACLAEEATPENLEIFLPDVRKIITNLLQGLRGKQTQYRRIVSDAKNEAKHQSANPNAPSERPESRASANGAKHESTASKRSRSGIESSDSLSRRSATSTRRKDSASRPTTNGSDQFVGGFAMQAQPASSDNEHIPIRASTPVRSQTARPPSAPNNNGYPLGRSVSASAVPLSEHPSPPLPPPPSEAQVPPVPRPPSVQSPVPSHVPRYSLSDRPVSIIQSPPPPPAVVVDTVSLSPPAVVVDIASPSPSNDDIPNSPPPDPNVIDTQAPAIQNSLAALKKNDILERRASKRFSTYTFSKMTGGSTRFGGGGGSRMSMAASSTLSPGELQALTDIDEEHPSPSKRDRARQRTRNPSPIAEGEEPPPVPPLPSREPSPKKPTLPMVDISKTDASATPSYGAPSPVDSSKTLTVFMQVGREVKKVSIDPGLSFSSLRMLFMDKFSYSPGKDNFPAIYIRDPSSQIQYELEDVEEVKDKCLLSLNIEPLDQIKQHIDSQIGTLSQDIKDLRAMVASNRRNSLQPPMIIGQPLAESTPTRPSERKFRNVARTISRLIPEERTPTKAEPEPSFNATPAPPPPILPQMTGASLQPQMTGASVMSEYSARLVGDLKTQFDEVQNLRRDLGIMRQLYTEFMKQTKESLGALRSQTQNVRQLASAKVGGARAYIDDGKAKLDTRSQNVLTKMEELQDVIEGIKDDVLKRNVSPRPQVLRSLKSDIDSITTELQSLKDHIQNIKPMWKKTWEEELQNIVEEQQFLGHQEELLNDLLEDRKAVAEIYGHIEKVISLRGGPGKTVRSTRGFKPPPPEEGHGGISTVMLEIRSAAVDQERRMKAIAANEKNREKELAARSDEFQAELTGFVAGKKLKMTGGAEEAERVRQRRNENTLKAMFSSSGTVTPSSSGEPLSPSTPITPDSS